MIELLLREAAVLADNTRLIRAAAGCPQVGPHNARTARRKPRHLLFFCFHFLLRSPL
jgi:hypothetical protein